MKTHAPPITSRINLIFHLKLCCLAALLTLPIALQLMATAINKPPPPIVDPPLSYFQDPIQTVPIKDTLTITGTTYNNTTTESAVYTVQTQGNVSVEPGANVTFETSKRVTLKSGFRAAQGSKFRARIGFSLETLSRPSEATGIPLGLFWVSNTNNNGVPDLVLVNLGLDPKADQSGNPQVQNLQQTTRNYHYDDNNQLINSSGERTYGLDEEGNINGQKQ